MANSNASPWDKGGRLAELVQGEKTLLLLDGMEPLQSYLDFERGKIKDPALAVLVTELAKENPGLCVITTREPILDLADFSETTGEIDLEQISAEAGRALLRVGGVGGTDAELEQVARDFGLHALALNLLAAYIYEIPGHHISNAAEIPDIDVPVEKGKHPRRVMAAFENRFGDDSAEVELLHILGLFSSPAEKDEIAAERAEPAIPNLTEQVQELSESEWLQLIQKLRHLKLLAPESKHRPDSLDAHPLVREHFGAQLKGEYPEAWREGHNRLYEYYKASAKDYPDTLEEMAPLFAAVMHGCQAGRHQETMDDVFQKRLDRGKAFIAMELGAMSSALTLLSGFFDSPWHQLVAGLRESTQGYVLSNTGFCLRALGRLSEAAQLMQAGLETRIGEKNWKNAASSANNLSELYLTIGDVKRALAYAEQSVGLTDKSDDAIQKCYSRAKIAAVLHQAGNSTESQRVFHEAEELQKKGQPNFPILYSLRGFQYCDLLLSQGSYEEVKRRASQALEWAMEYLQSGGSLLGIALGNLLLGRAHLLQSQHEPNHPFTESLSFLNRAVDVLRESGNQDDLPRGLLARAEYYRVTGELDKAQKDLDEAFAIASRGGMGLHLADCHLEYARLHVEMFKRSNVEKNLLEARKRLTMAKVMIEKMGYHRRDKEVEELEKQLAP